MMPSKMPSKSIVKSNLMTLALFVGPTFEEALRDQLGPKMESRKSPMDIIVVDHLEHPWAN
jgi:uncharacterized protein (TIGR03435 family)